MKAQFPRAILGIALTAFFLRFFFLVTIVAVYGTSALFTNDSYGFYQTGLNVLAGHGFSRSAVAPFILQAHFPPLYPLLIAASIFVSGSVIPLILVQIILSSLLSILVWKMTGYITDEPRIRTLAAALTAFEPLMMLWSLLLLTEVTSVFTMILGIYFFLLLAEKRRMRYALYSGLCIAVSTLIRPHGQFIFILCLCYLGVVVVAGLRRAEYGALARAGLFIVVFFAVLFPWIIRNYYQFGTLGISTTGPRNLYTSWAPAILAVETGREFGDIKKELFERFGEKYHASGIDIAENLAYSPLLAREGIAIARAHPLALAKLTAMDLNAFFTQDLLIDYLRRFHVLNQFRIDFSPSVVLMREGPLAVARLAWERAGAYVFIALAGRIFWVSATLLWILGAAECIRRKGSARAAGVLFAAIIVCYASTSLPAGFSDFGRFRYPASGFIFMLASVGISAVGKMRRGKFFSRSENV